MISSRRLRQFEPVTHCVNHLRPRTLHMSGAPELTNHDSAGAKNYTVLTSNVCRATFLTGEGIEYSQKGFYNSETISDCKVNNIKHFVSPNFQVGAKTRSSFVECRQVRQKLDTIWKLLSPVNLTQPAVILGTNYLG